MAFQYFTCFGVFCCDLSEIVDFFEQLNSSLCLKGGAPRPPMGMAPPGMMAPQTSVQPPFPQVSIFYDYFLFKPGR